jgi:predicted ATPase/DNA-binding CsgD family transcriptional regulator
MGEERPPWPGTTHGFVAALTSFVGRDSEVTEVAALLQEYRLVTVTGPGGMGKTRLAEAVARLAASRFADGAWLVELAAVSDPGQVAAVVAERLGVSADAGQPLAVALARQQLLLVLDNCEHVLDSVAELCAAVLPAADDVRILATSREPIGLAGEVRFRLRPLPTEAPDDSRVPTAVRLFADRARQADPRFVLDDKSAVIAAQLVRRLDGMPLAIELAAARVEALGLSPLLDRFDGSLQLLTNVDRTAPGRHQSLAATVEWSYRLLGEEEQRVFRRLAVFPGPFTLEAAVAVAGPGTEPAVLHLVDCSLLSPPRPGADGGTRYLMAETVRAFGAARLHDSAERAGADVALAGYALSVAEQAAVDRRTPEEPAAVRRLDAEDAAIQQSVAWALEHDPDTALRLAVAVAEWWLLRGRSTQAREVLLGAASHVTPGSPAWCRAQFWLGDIGPAEVSIGHETAALEVLSAQGPTPLLAETLAGRSRSLLHFGRISEAVRDARQALEVARQAGYPGGEVLALAQLSRLAHFANDSAAALDWARQAQQVLASGEHGWAIRFSGPFIIEVLLASGDLMGARRSLTDGLTWARETGNWVSQSSLLFLAADLELHAGNLDDSGRNLREAIETGIRTGTFSRLLLRLDLLGHLCAARGQWAEAVTIWAAFQVQIDAKGTLDLPLHAQRRQEPLREAARVLGPDCTSAARERGAAMSLPATVEFALLLTDTPAPRPLAPPPEEAGLTGLSAREQELITLVANGHTDAQIATELFISVSTVRSHLDRIRDKTSCRRRADLTRLALQAGLV